MGILADYVSEISVEVKAIAQGDLTRNGDDITLFNSKAASHDKGQHFRLLDVDDWPLFIRVNQNTGIQKESVIFISIP